MIKKYSLPLLSLLAALPVAAQVVSVGDVSGFKEALKGSPAPATPSMSAPASPLPPLPPIRCAVLSLNGATVGRGLFQNDYAVKIAGEEVGRVEAGGSGLDYSASGRRQADVSFAFGVDGARRATVSGCDGETVGTIVETDASDSSRFRVEDAAGKFVAGSGDVDGTTWSLAGPGVSATITNADWIRDDYALAMSGVDGRLVLTAAIMNNQALYRRAEQRRLDNPREPRGRP
jgi:hypothetical protein